MANNSVEEAELKKVQSKQLYIFYLLTGNLDYLQQAVHCAQESLDLMPPDFPLMPDILYNLARSLFRRFLHTRQVQDITKAIEMFGQASQLLTDDNPVRQKSCHHLIICYFVRDGNLDRFLEVNAPGVYSQSRPSLVIESALIFNLGEGDELFDYLHSTMIQSPLPSQYSVKDVDSAIQLSQQALKFFSPPPSSPVKISIILFHLGTLLNVRYSLQSKLEDNKEAIDCFCRALRLGLPILKVGHCLTFASIAFRRQFDALGEQEDLDNAEDLAKQAMTMLGAVDHAKRAMKIFHSRDPCSKMCLDNLAKVMSYRYRAPERVNDLNLRMDTLTIKRAWDIAEGNDSEEDLPTGILLNNLAANLRLRVQRTANNSAEEAELKVQSKKLYISYLLTGNLDDIQQAVHCAQKVFALMPPDVPLMPGILYNLARPLFRRFLHTRQIQDIMQAIEMFRHASQLLAAHDPMRQKCYHYLIISYFVRDGSLDRFLGLNAPDVHSQSRPSLVIGIPHWNTLIYNLFEGDEVFDYLESTMLKSPLPSQPSLKDVDSAIQVSQQALEFFSPPPSNPVKISTILFHLGTLLTFRYDLNSKFEDNNEGADCFCRALRLGLPTISFGKCLICASGAILTRFDALGEQEDLDNAEDLAKQAVKMFDAIDHAKQAMKIFDSPHAGFAMCLDTLARVMGSRYRVTGEMKDLNAAIGALNRAVDIAEQNDSKGELPILLNNLAFHLRLRSHSTGQAAEDMEMSIAMLQRAVDMWQPKDPRRTQCFVNLSTIDKMRSAKLLDQKYTRQAVGHLLKAWSTGEEALGLNPGLDLSLINGLASYRLSEESITLARVGTSPVFAHHPLAGQSRAILCSNLHYRWRRSNDIKDIDEVISTARSMIELAGPRTDESILGRKILGDCLYDRYKSTGDEENRKTAVDVLLEGFYMSAGAPFLRIQAGQKAIDILSEQADWKRARELSLQIVDLLLMLNGRSLKWEDKQFLLRQFSYQAATYASIALEAGSDVLDVIDLLETCRGSILGHVIDSRTDLDDLKEAAPELAERFRTLQNKINAAMDSSGNMNIRVEQSTRRREAEVNIRACLQEIRTLRGFHRFLLGPVQSELKKAAARGPILIVNITAIRSDAIIITEDAFVLLPLPELKYQKAAEYLEADLTNFSNIKDKGKKNRKYRQLQKWLWDNCVKLIFKKLGNLGSGPAKFHVWWIGIGMASSLPFHAAGVFTRNSSETALSQAISSYTPTLKVLIHSRRKLKNDRLTSKREMLKIKPPLAIITMPSTPGMADLEGVHQEAEEIQKEVWDTYSTEVILQPSAKDTMARMAKCEVVHFACHGESILEDPSSSHLLLQATNPDSGMPVIDKLKVRDVATTDLSHGKLAFLSACSTAQNRLTTLRDEVLHLVSGFHVAGYLHAIGNLWPADDEVSVQLVKGFYRHLVAAGEFGNGHNVAKALNQAMIDVAEREEYMNQPLSWAQFVHFGV